MAPRIQFQTVTTKKYTRVQWSDDHGQTWHEPEEATIEVARAWQHLQARIATHQPQKRGE
jgi:hypothetical protein